MHRNGILLQVLDTATLQNQSFVMIVLEDIKNGFVEVILLTDIHKTSASKWGRGLLYLDLDLDSLFFFIFLHTSVNNYYNINRNC